MAHQHQVSVTADFSLSCRFRELLPKQRKIFIFGFGILLLLTFFCFGQTLPISADERCLNASGKIGAVSTGHPQATKAAMKTLTHGGNAVDAAVAAAFALAVTDLSNSGIGGEGFALIRLKSGKIEAWDGSIKLPRSGKTVGCIAGLPSEPALLIELLKRHGTLSLPDVMAPAIRLAEEGFEVSPYLEMLLMKRLRYVRDSSCFAVFAPMGRPLRAGEKLVQPILARTLRGIAADGGESFYRGESAKILVNDLTKRGSRYTLEDFMSYLPKSTDPVSLQVGKFTFIGTPPPSSSVVAMALAADILSIGKIPSGKDLIPFCLPLIQKAIYVKNKYLPACLYNPRKFFTYYNDLKYFDVNNTKSDSDSENFPPEQPPETTHLVTWDGTGMVVSMTLTLGMHFGSGDYSPLGFFYNGELKNYTYNKKQVQDSYPQDIGPISSKAPLIVLEDSAPVLAIGGAGNNRIISNVGLISAFCLSHAMTLTQAVNHPRMYFSGKGDAYMEWSPEFSDLSSVKGKWKNLKVTDAGSDYFGLISAIHAASDTLIAVGDYRRDGCAGAVTKKDAETSHRFQTRE